MFICAYKINKQPPLSVVWCGLRFVISISGSGFGSAWVASTPPMVWCGSGLSAWAPVVWCSSAYASAWGGWIGVVIIINNIIISIIIPFLVGSSVTGTGACQERDPRDSCMFNSLMSESWLESVHCHKNRVCLGRVDGFGAATWKKCAHSQRFGRVGRG